MLKLRNILLHNTIFIIILLITILITVTRIFLEPTHTPKDIKNTISSSINSYSLDGNKLTITMNKYHLIGTYFIKTKQEKDFLEKTLKIGDTYQINGKVFIPKLPTTKYLFNYRDYLKTKKIYYQMTIKNIKKLSNTNNSLYILKNIIIKRIKKNPYLHTLILGDKSYLSSSAIYSYQENGISHLFAISGMHITLLSSIILKLLTKVHLKENTRYLITSIILLIYLLLVGPSPSILRGVLFFYLFTINRLKYLYIKSTNLLTIALSITLLINPFYVYDVGFLFSYTISLGLLLSTNILNSNNYFIDLLKVSYLSIISSLPISLYHYSSINILCLFYNFIFVPMISLIIFPMSLIVLLFPFLIKPYNFITNILESLSILCSKIKFGKLIFKRLNIFYYIILEIIIFILIIYQNRTRKNILTFILPIILIHYLLPYFDNTTYLKMINVGQGDSILLYSKNKTVLVDTGGNASYKEFKWQESIKEPSIVKSTTIPLLKKLGIKKLDYLILTHGDYDHIGEANNLIDSFNVKNIIINSNEINYLEKNLVLNSNNIIVGDEQFSFKIGDLEFIQLNENLGNENDSSQIYLVSNDKVNILLTGDASIKSERILLSKYNLPKVDILKVGHHGSKTSTSKELLKKIKPSLALISVGENNKFNHPNKETIDNLNSYKVPYLRTDIYGTITVNLNNLKVKADGKNIE